SVTGACASPRSSLSTARPARPALSRMAASLALEGVTTTLQPRNVEATPTPYCHGMQRLLVVEDEVDIADFLSRVFTKEGWEVGVANSGLTALEAVRREPPDLVVLDW